MSDLRILDDFRKEIEYCTFCPKMCRFSCPVAETELRETVTPTGKQTIVHLIHKGALPLTDESVEIFFKCTGCLHCQEYCLHEIDVPRSLEAARTYAYREGKTLPAVFQLAERMRRFGNPYGRALLPELRKLAPEKYFQEGAGIVLYPGAHLIAERSRTLRRLLGVLAALGVEVFLPNAEALSAGIELLDAGDREGFAGHAAKVKKMLEKAGEVVFAAPQDAAAARQRYPEFGQALGGKGTTLPEFLLAHLEPAKDRLKALSGRKVAYHDPCSLVRRLDVVEAPRKILELCGVQIVEAPWKGRDANCCGAGGAYADVFPEDATAMARKRMEEFGSLRGVPLVTASPRCECHLDGAKADEGIQVLDVVDIVAESLGVN
ncbi:MAG: (Fe-S)-binding protein [Bdellovibrionota bacterium]